MKVSGLTSLCLFLRPRSSTLNINDLFGNYGNISLLDFIREHEGIDAKHVVIDSAEKLADLTNQEAFQEFLSTLLQHDWKVIFTTRSSYLDDLRFQFVEVYRLPFEPFNVQNLSADELEILSNLHNFSLPTNGRLLDLLRDPFYLNEYLQAYDAPRGDVTLAGFKALLWARQIAKTSYRVNNIHIRRETCFVSLAKARADAGGLFIGDVAGCDDDALSNLEADEIIERDPKTGRFFITHDIYEEWALEKFIETAFHSISNRRKLFDSLGSSLPIRRAFRNWLSEKLLTSRDQVRPLIEASFTDDGVETHWKDEIVISVLLSDYAEIFFQMFESALLAQEQKALMRVIFLLRIACKEIDDDLLRLLGVSKRTATTLQTVFTKPKGSGWNRAIEFVYRHREQIGNSGIETVLPLLEDWNSKNQTGSTTRFSGLLALYHYEQARRSEKLRYRDLEQRKKQLIGIVLNASAEIKDELKAIFDEILSTKQFQYQSKYYELVRRVLSSATDSYVIARNLPEQVIQLADLVWYEDPSKERDPHERHSRMLEVEGRFCISSTRTEYFPASAFQTPIFQLLNCAPKATLDFILSFTNRAVECYAKSRLDEVRQVEVLIGHETVKQYISSRLWNTYRGTQLSTYLLESIHMALEKWLLEHAKTASQAELEGVCKYLLKNSQATRPGVLIVAHHFRIGTRVLYGAEQLTEF